MRVLYYSVLIVILDQFTKILVKGFKIPFLNINHEGMKINSSIKLLDDFIQITHVENYGLAFGIEIVREFKVLITLLTIFAVLLILYYLYISRYKDIKIRLAIAFILGGATGNIIDRVFYGVLYGYAPLFHGRVVDFIHIDFFDYNLFGKTYQSLPIFNLADVAVLTGLIMLLVISFKSKLTETPVSDAQVDNFLQDNSFEDENRATQQDEKI